MAHRDSVRQPENGEGAVVFGPPVYEVPLLPYERELIKTIGITEEEYKNFTAEVRRRGFVRPAEYAHIPDIRNDAVVTPILVSLAVGLITTGVSYLLTPKPRMPSASRDPSRGVIDLGDVTGTSRFTPSRGFETLAELADYASPIPIIFGRYDKGDDNGGMLVSPRLVWSRMFSHGSFQRAQLLFIVGEQGLKDGIDFPELEGIFLGNNALDVVYEDFFAFYWKPNSNNTSRIRAGNIRYGTRGRPDSGDPSTGGQGTSAEVFIAPTFDGDSNQAFCHAYSPGNNTQFGVHSALANGTSFRVNYETVAIPEDVQGNERAVANLAMKRAKIVGDENYFKPRNQGGQGEGGNSGDENHVNSIKNDNMKSLGRNYSPRMGITELTRASGGTVTAGSSLRVTATGIKVGDRAKLIISASSIDRKMYDLDGRGETVDDINGSVQALQMAADDAYRLGELFEIGGCIWKVRNRKIARFEPAVSTDQVITLECIDVSQSRNTSLGIVSKSRVVAPSLDYIGDQVDSSQPQSIGEGFFPINKVAIATIRNNRPAVVTEFGIKSTVFQSLKGICSFTSLLDPNQLEEYEEDNIQVNSGRITAYIVRSTVFRVFIRVAGDKDATEMYPFPAFFCVRGHRPVPQYTFLRFINPTTLGAAELEYKFVQMSGSELRDVPGSTKLIDISQPEESGSGNTLKYIQGTVQNVGVMQVACPGVEISKEDIARNKEFFRNGREIPGIPVDSIVPSAVDWVENTPTPEGGTVAIGELLKKTNDSNLNGVGGKVGAFTYAIAGNPNSSQYSTGVDYVFKTTEYDTQTYSNGMNRFITIAWTLNKSVSGAGFGPYYVWTIRKAKVVGCGPGWRVGDTFQCYRGSKDTSRVGYNGTEQYDRYPDSNPWGGSNVGGSGQTRRWSGRTYQIQRTEYDDLIVGRAQGYRYVLFGDANDVSLGTTKEIERVLEANKGGVIKKVKVKMSSYTKLIYDGLPVSFDRKVGWQKPKLEVILEGGDTTTNWEQDETLTDRVNVTASNPFRTIYKTAGVRYKVSVEKITTPQPPKVTGDAAFATQSQYTDISLYRDFVEKSNDNAPEHEIVYVNEIQQNEEVPVFNDVTLAGLSLKASRNFTQLDQLRCWLPNGISVERLHPNLQSAYNDTAAKGPSSLFTDLFYYLLTDQMAGAGALLDMSETNAPLVDKDELIKTSRFLHKEKLYFNGSITARTNIRDFFSDMAPYFLCNFMISNGKFSLRPALPINGNGKIVDDVPIDQIFTEGNILEDTYKLEYLSAEERRPFQAVLRYRHERKNRFPEERAINVKGGPNQGYSTEGVTFLPQEQFDLTQFCTSEEHAILVGKYFLSLRKLVTHTVSFSTTLDGLSIGPGSYIKVETKSSPYSSTQNGTVDASGTITSVSALPDGQYNVVYYTIDSNDTEEGVMQVSNGKTSDSTFFSSVFSVMNQQRSTDVYIVEQLTFSKEGTVDIVASEHPCFLDGGSTRSKLVDAILNDEFKVF